MANRTVTVKLVAEAAQYRREMVEASKDTADLKGEVARLGTGVDHTGERMHAVAEDVVILHDEVAKLGAGAGKAGDQLASAAKDAGHLERALKSAEDEVKRLVEEFDRTGDVKLFKQLREQQGAISTLKRMRTELHGADDDLEQLGDTGEREVGRLGKVLGTLPGALGNSLAAAPPQAQVAVAAGLAALLVAAAPAAGAAAAAGVIGTVGGGGLVAGIKLAAKQPAVTAAWQAFATSGGAELAASANSFVGPLINVIGGLGKAVHTEIAPELRGIFGGLSREVEPLASGLLGLVHNAFPGLRDAAAAAAPLLHTLAAEMPAVGDAVSDFLHSISAAEPGAERMLKSLLSVTEYLIVATGKTVEGLGKSWDWLSDHAALVAGTIPAALLRLSEGGHKAAGGLEDLAGAAQHVEATVLRASDALQTYLNGSLSTEQATLEFQKSLDRLSDSVDRNGTKLAGNSKEARANREEFLASIQVAQRHRQAMLDAGQSADAANAAFDRDIQTLRRHALAIGMSKREVDDLIAKLYGIPATRSTKIVTPGMDAAKERARELGRTLNAIPSDIYVTTHYRSTGSPGYAGQYSAPNRWGGYYEHAADGLLRQAQVYSPASPGRYMIAEPQTGGEAFIPRFGDVGRSVDIISKAAGWYGLQVGRPAAGGVTRMELVLSGGDPATAALLSTLRREIRIAGGNVQLVLGKG